MALPSIWTVSTIDDTVSEFAVYSIKLQPSTLKYTPSCIVDCYGEHLGIFDTCTGELRVYTFDNADCQRHNDTILYEGPDEADQWVEYSVRIPAFSTMIDVSQNKSKSYSLIVRNTYASIIDNETCVIELIPTKRY